MVGFDNVYHFFPSSLLSPTGSRNGVVVDVHWHIWSLLVLQFLLMDLLHASYVWEGAEKQTNKQINDDDVMCFSHINVVGFFALTVLAKVSRYA